jgi:hypothetical protein
VVEALDISPQLSTGRMIESHVLANWVFKGGRRCNVSCASVQQRYYCKEEEKLA